MPLLTRKTVIAAAEESTAYTAETLAASDSDWSVRDVQSTPTVEMVERESSDAFSRRSAIAGLQSGSVSFKSDFYGDGAGGVPTWADVFFPAVGLVEKTSGVFSPRSAPPHESGSDLGVRTLTMGVYEDGRRKLLRGCMGNAKLVLETGKPIHIEWNYMGAWGGVSAQSLLAPTYPTRPPIRFANSTLTLGGVAVCAQKIEIDLGNNFAMRECQSASDGSGYRGAIVTDRKIGGTVDPEAVLPATYDAFGDWLASTERALVVEFADAEDTVTITIPKFQVQNIGGEGDRNGIRIDPLTFSANRSAAADDEMTIEFAAS